MRYILISFLIFNLTIFNFSCNNKTEKQIQDTADYFYKHYKGNFREADSSKISKDLQNKIKKTIAFEKQSAQFIKNSDHPTDKPLLLEGDLFVSLYEGYTGFNIKEIKQNGNKATAMIEFVNSNYQIKWTDEVVLVDEGEWKIDDVNYLSPSKKNLSLKLIIEEFINIPLQ